MGTIEDPEVLQEPVTDTDVHEQDVTALIPQYHVILLDDEID